MGKRKPNYVLFRLPPSVVAALKNRLNATLSRFGTLTVCAAIAALGLKSQIQRLPQQWTITPVGKQIPLMGDFPSRILENKDGTRLFVLTSGYHHQGLTVIDARTEAVISFANLGKVYGDAVADGDSDRIFIAGGGAI